MCKKSPTNFPSAMQERKSDSNPEPARKRHSANPCGAWMKWWWVVSLSVSMWGVIIANCCWSHDPIAFCVGSPAQQATNLEAETILSYWSRESSKHKGRSEEHQKFFCPTKNPYLTHKFCTNQRLALKTQDGGHAKGQRKATAKRSSLRYSAVSDISKNVILHNIAAKTSVLVSPKKGMITPNMELIANLQTLPSDQEDRRRRALEEKSKWRRNVTIKHKDAISQKSVNVGTKRYHRFGTYRETCVVKAKQTGQDNTRGKSGKRCFRHSKSSWARKSQRGWRQGDATSRVGNQNRRTRGVENAAEI